MIEIKHATYEDIPAVESLQLRYHVSTISEEDKKDGFVTTLFTPEQLKSLIDEEDGLFIAVDGDEVVAYAMAASWDYWSAWPLFQYMIEDLPKTEYKGDLLSTDNSYQYGPICIEKSYRGQGIIKDMIDYIRKAFPQYKYLITFVNQVNPRSYRAHTVKAGLELIKTFQFSGNDYYELGCIN